MVRKKPVYVFNPVTFDPATALPRKLQKHADSARYILHRIYWGQFRKKTTEGGYVPLKTDYLRQFIPKRVVKPLMTALKEAGVIESDRYYVPGHKSYAYRFVSPLHKDRIVRIQLGDTKLTDNIKAEHRAEQKKVRLDVHRYLRSQLKSLEIDQCRATTLLANDRNSELLKLPVLQIANGERSFTVCRYGRVHTDLTHLKATLRPCLHVNGEPLVSIDIKNSQPLFLALLILHRRLYGDHCLLLSAVPSGRSNPYQDIDAKIASIVSPLSPPCNPLSNTTDQRAAEGQESPENSQLTDYDTCRTDLRTNSLTSDEQRFLSLCESGELYEALMAEADIPLRRWAKELLFQVLYGKNKSRSELKSRFAEIFPSVYETTKTLKRKDHRRLSQLLQNLESTVVINRVCRGLMEDKVSPVFTIHDSILTTEAHIDCVLSHFQEIFKALGVAPSFHVTRLAELVTSDT